MSNVVNKINELKAELEEELKKDPIDEGKIKKLRAKIFTLGLQLTRNDMYLK